MPKTPDYFKGKTIVFTGAASGPGRVAARNGGPGKLPHYASAKGAVNTLTLGAARADEIGELVLFLCSDACEFLIADTVLVTGGGYR